MRLLLIEDDEMYASLVEMAFRREGFELITAHTPEEGLAMATQHEFAAIIVDVALPGISGIEVLRRLRADPRTADMPIIIATASGTLSTRKAAQEGGADAFYEKPFSFQDMAAYIRSLYE